MVSTAAKSRTVTTTNSVLAIYLVVSKEILGQSERCLPSTVVRPPGGVVGLHLRPLPRWTFLLLGWL